MSVDCEMDLDCSRGVWPTDIRVTDVIASAACAVAMGLCVASLLFFCGCAYKGGKVVDGTNLAIGITVPGTEWCINAVDYVAGLRVAGNDSTRIVVSNEVVETNSYFGCVTTSRHTRMTADIEPMVTDGEDDVE